ncbi:hypothetical protein ACQPWY_19545 [Pseudonocardia xinjiangensis]|uniref:hypothetical protein n=1 Tax=Pseudonocardia xinjiangensis TaxID=75289 RepID=UPI003D8D0A5C
MAFLNLAEPGVRGGRRSGTLLRSPGRCGRSIDDLTVPELLAPHRLDVLIDAMVTRLLPES